ncbi:hypothetical protein Goari_014610 [Gossypium aridum]|uniref:ELMO domain-containing protein n=1 Tax=Gossypium aridum TaxID=34290 RepID=A0A7J8XID3_GOSAI|nr:hypothetical protein [Gossypium aridum]
MRPVALRRRLDHGDVGRMSNGNYMMTGLHGLDEPLLGNRDYDGRHSEGKTPDCIWVEGQWKEHLHWAALLFTNLIVQWAQWIANIVLGSVSFIARILPLPSNTQSGSNWKLLEPALNPLQRVGRVEMIGVGVAIWSLMEACSDDQHIVSPPLFCGLPFSLRGSVKEMFFKPLEKARVLQTSSLVENLLLAVTVFKDNLILHIKEARLRSLQQRLGIPHDGSRLEHQEALKQLWKLAYPDRELLSLKSELWKDMGWQGPDPSTDFRGGGFISLENLIFFAKKYPQSFQRLLHKQDGNRSEWEYPFAVAGINISFMLVQMLDLQSGKPSSRAGRRFLELLAEDEMAFDDLYCVTFQMMDAQWLVKRASYMEFNEILKSTRTRLEHELSLESVSRVKDLPAYSLLKR